MLVIVILLASPGRGDSFNHFPETAGRSDDIIPHKVGVAPTGRPGLDNVDAGGAEALIAFVGGRNLDDTRKRMKRKSYNIGYKPWERARNDNNRQKQNKSTGSRQKHQQRILMPKGQASTTEEKGVKTKRTRNIMRMRNTHKDEQKNEKRNHKLSVVKKRKEDQMVERSSDDQSEADTTRNIDMSHPSSFKENSRMRRMNVEKVAAKSRGALPDTVPGTESLNEDSPMVSETELESPNNYLALAKLAQVTWMQDPFRVRRHLLEY